MFVTPAFAQENQSLVGNRIRSGGFGGPVVKISSISGKAGLLSGIRGGWIIKLNPSTSFVIGAGSYELVTNVKADNIFACDIYTGNTQLYVSLNYYGFELEYVHHSNRLIHFSLQSLIGGGEAGYQYKKRISTGIHDSFFVLEPGANVLLNVTNFFRIGAGLGFRITTRSRLAEVSDSDLTGLTGLATFKFGKF